MNDNASCHTGKSVKVFVGTVALLVLPSPRNSPDVECSNVTRLLKENTTKAHKNIDDAWQNRC